MIGFKRSNAKTVGQRGEDEAVAFFKKQGFKIIERNYRYSHYEIDFIAKNKEYLVFVEVKSRSCISPDDMPFGTPAMAIDRNKKRFVLYAAEAFLRTNPYDNLQPRIDVVEIYFDNNKDVKNKKILKINHFPNAFGA